MWDCNGNFKFSVYEVLFLYWSQLVESFQQYFMKCFAQYILNCSFKPNVKTVNVKKNSLSHGIFRKTTINCLMCGYSVSSIKMDNSIMYFQSTVTGQSKFITDVYIINLIFVSLNKYIICCFYFIGIAQLFCFMN